MNYLVSRDSNKNILRQISFDTQFQQPVDFHVISSYHDLYNISRYQFVTSLEILTFIELLLLRLSMYYNLEAHLFILHILTPWLGHYYPETKTRKDCSRAL